jgi:hypothetical protein
MRRLAIFLGALALTLGAAVPATASHVAPRDTGWFCPNLAQTANIGGGYSYVCWSYRWFIVHRENG